MGACNEMIHSETTSGQVLDVDCDSSTSESFDFNSKYDVSDSENDVSDSDSECDVSNSENDVSDSNPDYDVSD